MPIRTENQNPPFNITRLSHVLLSSRDLDKTRYFYETGLGLEVSYQDQEFLYLRCLEEPWHHSLIFKKHKRDVLRSLFRKIFRKSKWHKKGCQYNDDGKSHGLLITFKNPLKGGFFYKQLIYQSFLSLPYHFSLNL